jgi:voltage-gated potassium channel
VARRLRRALQAQIRDTYVLVQESRISLVLFLIIIFGGALVFHLAYIVPGTGRHPALGEALYATFSLLFFSPELPFPDQWYLQALYFVIPILGLAAVADGILRFGGALVSKQSRGQKWQVAMASTYHDHVIICGVGKVGYRVILELLKFDQEIVAVEKNPDNRFIERIQALDIPLLIADARRKENIIKAGVERADAIIPCTDDELTNLDIALEARELNPDIRVVMRMFDADFARRVENGFGIQVAFSTSALAAPIFASAAMGENILHSLYVGENLLHLSHVKINQSSPLCNWTVGKLEGDLDLSVICYEKDGCMDLHPHDDIELHAPDEILVLASLKTLRELTKINSPQGEVDKG